MGIVERTFNNGEVIIKEGDNGSTFFQLLEGTANVFADYGKKEQFRLAVLEEGEYFGEMAIIETYPRSATVVANSKVRALEIPGNELKTYFEEQPDMIVTLLKHLGSRLSSMTKDYNEAQDLLDELRESDSNKKGSLFSKIKKHINMYQTNKAVFTEMSAESVNEAFEAITDEGTGDIQSYENRKIICSEGDTDRAMFILRGGKVGIYKNYGERIQQKISELSPVSFFGELGMLSDDPLDITAVAEADETYVEVIREEYLDSLIQSCPVKIDMLLKHLSFRLRQTNYDFLKVCKEITETYENK